MQFALLILVQNINTSFKGDTAIRLDKDQGIGALILVGSIVGIIAYGALLYFFRIQILALTAFVGVAGIFIVLAWIGYTMASTPPPAPIEATEPTTPSKAETSKDTKSSSGSKKA